MAAGRVPAVADPLLGPTSIITALLLPDPPGSPPSPVGGMGLGRPTASLPPALQGAPSVEQDELQRLRLGLK
jgi:hypothetical protein